MWSPNVKEPLVKMLCHGSGMKAIAVDPSGKWVPVTHTLESVETGRNVMRY